MSVIRDGDYIPSNDFDSCFFCGDPAGRPRVEWCGKPTVIALHPGCAIALSVHLCSDSLKASYDIRSALKVPL